MSRLPPPGALPDLGRRAGFAAQSRSRPRTRDDTRIIPARCERTPGANPGGSLRLLDQLTRAALPLTSARRLRREATVWHEDGGDIA